MKLTAEIKDAIKMWVNENCTVTLTAICRRLLLNFNVSVVPSTVARILDDFNYSLKRIHLIPEKRNDGRTVALRREYALEYISLASEFSENEIIFIDEAGFNVSMRSTRGRSLVGSPAILTVPSIR